MTAPQPTSGGTPVRHGTLTGYTRHHCRCAKCTARHTAWRADRARRQAYGTWQPTVPSDRVQAHVRALIGTGLTRRQISHLAGVSMFPIRTALGGRPLRAVSAEALLAVRAGAAAPEARDLDATGSRRRLQALVACGWPMRELARRLAMDHRDLAALIHGRTTRVSGPTVARIRALYDQLWNVPPTAAGVSPGRARHALRTSWRHGWAPPLAWDDDDLDNPAAQPSWTGRCGTTGGYHDHTLLGTPTCQPCRDAVAAAARERKTRRRQRDAAA